MSLPVKIERHAAVAVVTMNRPERHNALDADMKNALLEALVLTARDRDVRAVVVAGSGTSFCVGQDLGEHARALHDNPRSAFDTVLRDYAPIVRELATMPKPVIAAVNGTCVGAGLALALACDLRVFSETATLATAFSAVGLTCDSGLSWTLTRAVGDAKARELVLTGRAFTTAQAVKWGLTGDVVPANDVSMTALGQATKLAKGPTRAFAETKVLIEAAFSRTLDDALAAEAAAQARCGATDDHIDAVAAFLDKRAPAFSGR